MAWTVYACDTATGAILGCIPAESFSWDRVLNSGGSGQSSFRVGDPLFRELNLRSWTDLVRRTLVLDWNGEPVYAGIVWRRVYERDSQTLTVNHSDLWSMLTRRYLVSQRTTGVEKTKLEFTNISISTVVKRTVQAGTADLPMVYWGDFEGSRKAVFEGYMLKSVADALQDQIDQPDGPDLDFRPIWGPNGLQWQMRSNQEFGTYTWNMSAAQSGVSGLKVIEDGTKLANNVFAVGQGTEKDSIIRASPAPSPYPLLQSTVSHKDEKDLVKLDGFVQEAQRIYGTPTGQWSFNMLASGGNGETKDLTKVTDLRLNGVLSLYESGDPWIPDGTSSHRLIRYSGDLTEQVKLEFQPTGGV